MREKMELAEELHDLDTENFGLDPEITKPIIVDDGSMPRDNLEVVAA